MRQSIVTAMTKAHRAWRDRAVPGLVALAYGLTIDRCKGGGLDQVPRGCARTAMEPVACPATSARALRRQREWANPAQEQLPHTAVDHAHDGHSTHASARGSTMETPIHAVRPPARISRAASAQSAPRTTARPAASAQAG